MVSFVNTMLGIMLTKGSEHQASIVQKIFVINFITSYTPIFLTAFVYVPFAHELVPYLDVFQVTAQRFAKDGVIKTKQFEINKDRLRAQVVYFTVTAQIINLLTEVVVPFAKRKIFKTVEHVKEEISKHGETSRFKDSEDEAPFLARVRNEATLEVYDVTVDYREMVVQFGYLSICSVVWPLAACSFLVNNWVEARSDAMKIAIGSQRPVPWRADSIGPWLNALGFLSWLGTLTSSAIVFLFREAGDQLGSPSGITGWALLLSILFAEHVYMVVQLVVRHAIEKIDSPGLQRDRAERFALRKRMLAESLGEVEADKSAGLDVPGAEAITRETLEEEARRASQVGGTTPDEL